jgi:hypothetical protein
MLRCLTIDPAVARPTRGWRASGTFQAALLISPAVGTRQGFAAPFRPDLSSGRGGITAAGKPPAGAHAPVEKCAPRGALVESQHDPSYPSRYQDDPSPGTLTFGMLSSSRMLFTFRFVP